MFTVSQLVLLSSEQVTVEQFVRFGSVVWPAEEEVKQELVRVQERPNNDRRQDLAALGQVVDVVDTEQTEADISPCVCL